MDKLEAPVDNKLLAEVVKDALNKGEHPSLTVISNSMSPLIEVNDLVKLSSIHFDSLEKGDIITVYQREAFTTHRVVSKDIHSVVTKGDRNLVFDKPVSFEQVVGKVSHIHSKQLSFIIDLEASQNRTRLDLINRLMQFKLAAKKKQVVGHRAIHYFVIGAVQLIKVSLKTSSKRPRQGSI